MGGKPSTLPAAHEAAASEVDDAATVAAAAAAAAAAASPPQQPAAPLTLSVSPASSREQRAAFDALIESRFPSDVRLVGLENYGNTCYCNATLQALYACAPFRRGVQQWAEERDQQLQAQAQAAKRSGAAKGKDKKKGAPTAADVAGSPSDDGGGSLLGDLASLFRQLSSGAGRSGSVGPAAFVQRMRRSNPQFQGSQHQDAQEFLIWMLNEINDQMRAEGDREREREAQRKAAEAAAAAKAVEKQTPQSQSQSLSLLQRVSLSRQSTVTTVSELRMPPAALSTHPAATAAAASWTATPAAAVATTLPPAAACDRDALVAPLALSSRPPGVTPLCVTTDASAAASMSACAASSLDTPQPSLLLQSLRALQAARCGPPADSAHASTSLGGTATPSSPSQSHASASASGGAATAAPAAAVSAPSAASPPPAAPPLPPPPPTLVQSVFGGSLLNRTRCLQCGHSSARGESFFDLSLEVAADSSLTHALGRAFSAGELLAAQDKYSCPACACKQEARKSMHVARYPPVLCVHLKRFKFVESAGEFSKLTDRVAFPMQMRLEETAAEADEGPGGAAEAGPAAAAPPSRLYSLTSLVIHIGRSLRHGHYVCASRIGSQWFCFDDDEVHLWSVEDVQSAMGSRFTGEQNGHLDAYLLLYSQVEEDE